MLQYLWHGRVCVYLNIAVCPTRAPATNAPAVIDNTNPYLNRNPNPNPKLDPIVNQNPYHNRNRNSLLLQISSLEKLSPGYVSENL